jgi:hypothetical protein
MTAITRSLAFLLLAASSAGAITPANVPQVLSPLSETMFRSDAYEYEYKSGVLRSQDLWAVVGVRARGQLGGPQQYQVWKLDAHGKKLRDVDLTGTSPINRSQSTPARVHELIPLKNGNMALLVETDRESALLVFDGESGQVVLNRPLSAISADIFINKVFPAADGGIIAVGRSGGSALLLKLSAGGEVETRVAIDDKELTVLSDGVELPDHTWLLLGEHLDDAGKVSVWLGKATAKGEVLSKTSFSGQGAAISCSGQERDCAVVYATPGSSDWSVSVRIFSETLALASQSDLMAGLKINPRFRIMARTDGSFFVVGGNAKNRLWMASVG